MTPMPEAAAQASSAPSRAATDRSSVATVGLASRLYEKLRGGPAPCSASTRARCARSSNSKTAVW